MIYSLRYEEIGVLHKLLFLLVFIFNFTNVKLDTFLTSGLVKLLKFEYRG